MGNCLSAPTGKKTKEATPDETSVDNVLLSHPQPQKVTAASSSSKRKKTKTKTKTKPTSTTTTTTTTTTTATTNTTINNNNNNNNINTTINATKDLNKNNLSLTSNDNNNNDNNNKKKKKKELDITKIQCRRPIFVSLYYLNKQFEMIPKEVLEIALFAFLLPRRWVFMINESWKCDTIYTANLQLKSELRELIYKKDLENMVLWIDPSAVPSSSSSSDNAKITTYLWASINKKLTKIPDLTQDTSRLADQVNSSKHHLNRSSQISLNGILTEDNTLLQKYDKYRDSWMYYILSKQYLDISVMDQLAKYESANEDEQHTTQSDSSREELIVTPILENDENSMATGDGDDGGNGKQVQFSEITRYVSTATEICHGLKHIDELKLHTLMELLYLSNPTSVLPLVAWNARLWDDFYDNTKPNLF